jgi:hypothetical protein
MQERWVEFVQDVFITIHENIRGLKERCGLGDPKELTHIKRNSWHTMKYCPHKSSEVEFEIPKDKLEL